MTVASLPRRRLCQAHAEDVADPVGGQPPKADLAASLEDLVNGEMAFEDEVPAILDLGDGVEPRQVHLAAFFFGKLRAQNQGPVVELLADHRGTQAIGGGL